MPGDVKPLTVREREGKFYRLGGYSERMYTTWIERYEVTVRALEQERDARALDAEMQAMFCRALMPYETLVRQLSEIGCCLLSDPPGDPCRCYSCRCRAALKSGGSDG